MDTTEYTDLSDASAESDLEVTAPFAPRLRRAVLTLVAAIAAHVWLLPALGMNERLSDPASEGSAVIAQSGIAVPPGLLIRREPGREIRKSKPVQVRTQFINLAPGAPAERGTRPPAMIERAVGTSGFLRAGVEIPDATPLVAPPSEALPSPTTPVELTAPRSALADVSARIETPEADVSATGRGRTVSAEDSGVPATSDRGAELKDEQKNTADLRKAELTAQEEIVRRVLLDYKYAYDHLDVNSLKAIWPSLDDRKLQRAFRGLEGQELRFAKCGVSVTGQDANARCQGDATYRPKVGSRVHVQEAEWTFRLARANDRWQIVKASVQ